MKKQVLKDRMYRLKSDKTPISTMINSTQQIQLTTLYYISMKKKESTEQ